MPLFVISWLDRPGAADARMGARAAHLAYVKAGEGATVKLGGPFLGPDGEMAGSLLIVEADDLAAAQAFHDRDPYKQAGVFERSDVRPWRATVGDFA